jgi:hypothetical protein
VKLTLAEFRGWKCKRITLLGMSGVGKTRLSMMLRRHNWFHYSGDYRIGTRYLDEPILDVIKQQAMRVPFLRDLLRSDSIYIRNNITVDSLGPVLSFVGKPGNPELGGLPLREFRQRQALYRQAEIDAMNDVPEFVRKANEVYGYQHFVNDVGGSLCELDEPSVIESLAKHTLILYIHVTAGDEKELFESARFDPKPLYFRPMFLDEALEVYLREQRYTYVAQMDPDGFMRWVFPRLFRARVPRYEAIARAHGYTVTSDEWSEVRDETDLLQLIESTIARDH